MKIRLTLLLLVLLSVLSCVLLSCGEDSGSIVGTWKITECIVDGEPLIDMNDCYFYFYEDNTGKKVILDELQFTFSYSYDGVTCVLFNLTYDDGEVEAGTYAELTVKGDTMSITATENGVTEEVTLRRQKDAE
ncbi:MAG: hypothetical protein IJ302_02775 [Clostridia bacterium]|nr:hypothetical protein [Clostridia bacterium]